MNDQDELGSQAVKEGLQAISDLGRELILENRRARRWKIIGRLFFGLILLAIFVLPHFLKDEFIGGGSTSESHVAVIQMNGVVMPGADIDADIIIPSLQSAFSAPEAKGVILQINSPGGSPVQAERIYDEILRLKSLHPDKRVVAVIGDIGASAAYYIASAADEIVASKSSLVGSIGVIINGFGAVDAMEKLGIERRLIIAGDNKAMLDPFSPKDSAQQAYMQRIVDQVHEQFIAAVKKGRGDRLLNRDDIFSGLVWNGSEAQTLGLIDHIGSMGYVQREIFDQETQIDYTPELDWLDELSKQVGTHAALALNRVFFYQEIGIH